MAVLKPCQRIQSLGFTIDSSRLRPLYSTPNDLFGKLAEVIGLIVSSSLAIKLARLHYRHLEFSKVNALKKKILNDFDAACSLSQETR
ncbi:hypothetical protein P5673_026491 [Acropora cervicornis]|uniref:Uncharacterized protein n=1 Tax=Acropora cervicornis TaxID=6130 RepID=A0AAD9UWC8_ACRCE|nr:hypothetical protein P5673_026491 [Acropora cervicornis]